MRSDFKGLNVLITSGPTCVPIDDMRVITNRSSGEMGRLLASAFLKKGAKVTMLEGPVTTALPLPLGAIIKRFYFYNELKQLFTKELCNAHDVVVHAAAVSDFSLEHPFSSKLSSDNKILLKLKPTQKLIALVKSLAPKSSLVGFKFEGDILHKKTIAKAELLLKKNSCSLVVLNENNTKGYRAVILSNDGSMTKVFRSKIALIDELMRIL